MRQEVISKQIEVSWPGEIQTFQIRLPEHTLEVIGVEVSYRLIDAVDPDVPVPFNPLQIMGISRNESVGEIKLQSCEKANIFFADHLKRDRNMGHGDFSANYNFRPKEYVHQLSREELPVCVKGKSTVIKGVYKDHFAEALAMKFKYSVSIHLWIKTETPQTPAP